MKSSRVDLNKVLRDLDTSWIEAGATYSGSIVEIGLSLGLSGVDGMKEFRVLEAAGLVTQSKEGWDLSALKAAVLNPTAAAVTVAAKPAAAATDIKPPARKLSGLERIAAGAARDLAIQPTT